MEPGTGEQTQPLGAQLEPNSQHHAHMTPDRDEGPVNDSSHSLLSRDGPDDDPEGSLFVEDPVNEPQQEEDDSELVIDAELPNHNGGNPITDEAVDDDNDIKTTCAPQAIEQETEQGKETVQHRTFARNPKEWFAKHQEKPSGHKRKNADTQSSRPPKLFKEAGWQHDETNNLRAKLINEAGDDFERAFALGDAPSMGAIQARTHKSQLEQMKANIPQGCDTRRTNSQFKDLEDAKKVFGYKKITAKDGSWLLKGMKTPLFNHQLTLAAWMVGRECGGCAPLGGLVGDDMGMGKTIVSLAVVDGNPPSEDEIEEYSHATLVVVPNAAIAKQWLSEVETHSSRDTASATVIFTHTGDRDREDLKEKRIVITTYGEVRSQWITPEEMKSVTRQYKTDRKGFQRELFKRLGALFGIQWYRVILDEAHAIKNIKAQTTQACCFLSSKYRWCLSGTPLANTAEEFFPYLWFMGCEFTESLTRFKEKYIKGHKAAKSLETLVSYIMYRRTKQDTMLGCKILDVPECTKLELWVPVAKEEEIVLQAIRDHYEAAIAKSRKSKSEPVTQKEKDEQLAALRAMYMMERQVCSHFYNLEMWFRKSFSLENLFILVEDLDKSGGIPLLDQFLEADPQRLHQFSTGLKQLRKLKSPTLSGCIDVAGLLMSIGNEKRLRRMSCALCQAKPPVAPIFSEPCGHIYCDECILGEMKKRSSGVKCVFPSCKYQLGLGPDISTLDRVVNGVEDNNIKEVHESTQDSNKTILRKEKDQNGMFITNEVSPDLHTPPSMKLLAVMVIILDWQKNHPEDKIIVFVTFVMTAKILGKMLNIAGIKDFLYYFGEVSQPKKSRAIEEFQEDPKKKILIMGLKCGALGLNLTAANRVIIVDPWWNNTVEQQAFGRVWRYKQKKVCHLVRIKSESLIDSKIAEMQANKSKEVDRALQDEGFFSNEINENDIDDDQLLEIFGVSDGEKKKKKNNRRKGETAN